MIKGYVCLPENFECIPYAVVTMTTANGTQSKFSGRHIQALSFPIFTDYSRKLPKCKPTSHEVFWNPLDPSYLKLNKIIVFCFILFFSVLFCHSLTKSPRYEATYVMFYVHLNDFEKIEFQTSVILLYLHQNHHCRYTVPACTCSTCSYSYV